MLSPMTGVPLANLSLTKNHVLRQAIEAFTEGLLQASQPAAVATALAPAQAASGQ